MRHRLRNLLLLHEVLRSRARIDEAHGTRAKDTVQRLLATLVLVERRLEHRILVADLNRLELAVVNLATTHLVRA